MKSKMWFFLGSMGAVLLCYLWILLGVIPYSYMVTETVLGFLLLALAVQVILWALFLRGKPIEGYFFSLPAMRFGTAYLVVQMLAGLLLELFAGSFRMTLTVEILIAGVFCALEFYAAAAGMAAREVEREKSREIDGMKRLKKEMRGIVDGVSDYETGKILRQIYDEIAYADPVGREENREVEMEIERNLSVIRAAAERNDREELLAAQERIRRLMSRRQR